MRKSLFRPSHGNSNIDPSPRPYRPIGSFDLLWLASAARTSFRAFQEYPFGSAAASLRQPSFFSTHPAQRQCLAQTGGRTWAPCQADARAPQRVRARERPPREGPAVEATGKEKRK